MQKTYNPEHLPKKFQDDVKILIQRGCLMHYATFMYFVVDEMKKANVENYEDIAKRASARCGGLNADTKYDCSTTYELKEKLYDEMTFNTCEGAADVTDDYLDVELSYCPYVTAWQMLTDDKEIIKLLCNIEMEGESEIFRQHPEWSYELTDTIAHGCKSCKMHIEKKA